MMRTIIKSKNSPLFSLMKEKYLLLSYLINPNSLNEVQSQEINLTDQLGSLLVEIKTSLINFNGSIHTLFMFTDSTDRKKLLEAYTISEHKDKLLVNIAQEFRTPINGISSMLELIKIYSEKTNLQIMECINRASVSLTLLKNHINDILDFSLLKNGKFSLHFTSFNIRELINEINKIIFFQAQKKEVLFETDVSPMVPILVWSDQTRLTQILLNLLCNSIKFTLKNGQINLNVSYDDDIGIRFEISDTGIGISEENLKQLFKKYGKINTLLCEALNPQGIGLGLVISKILAEELSPENFKKFEIMSEIGKGTTFSFYISNNCREGNSQSFSPNSKIKEYEDSIDNENLEIKNKNFEFLAKSNLNFMGGNLLPSMQQIKLWQQANENSLFIQKSTYTLNSCSLLFPILKCVCPPILVVDDDMFEVISLQEILKSLGFQSNYAPNGSEAILRLKERNEEKCCSNCQNFKILFIDFSMPILDGAETTKIIKGMDFLQSIKVIGYSIEEDNEKMRIAGCDDFLVKPFQIRELKSILNDYKNVFEE